MNRQATAPTRSLRPAGLALAAALIALYAVWSAGAAPFAPHQVLAMLLAPDTPTLLGHAESFAGMWQFVPFLLLPAAVWPASWRWSTVGAGAAGGALYLMATGMPQWWLYLYTFLAGAGVVALGFLVYQRLAGTSSERRAAAGHLIAVALIFVGFGICSKTYLFSSSAVGAAVLDLSALRLDTATLGFSPSAWANNLSRAIPGLRYFAAIAYETLPLAMMAVYGLEARDPGRVPFGLLKALFVCGFAAAITYAITPVAGPAYVFGASYPQRIDELLGLAPALMPTLPGFAPRNAFPSFHLAWALLAVLLTSRFRWQVGAGFGAYALMIAFATLALGEHYFIDLVAAFPALLAVAALCVESAAWRDVRRWQAFSAGVAMYAAWALLLQPAAAAAASGWRLVLFVWCIASIAASVWLYRRLLGAAPAPRAAFNSA